MAQDIESIVELLREMKRANRTSSESFEKLLNSLNSKLEVMEKNPASAEFVRSCIGDIVRRVDDSYSTTLSKFADIESALKTLYQKNDEHVKTDDIRELFEIFSQNMNNVYSEARQQKAVLSSMENKLADLISDKSDKEDILRTITLLRNDFDNINQSYRNMIDTVNTDLKNVLSNVIKAEQNSALDREQVSAVYKAVSDIINYLTSIDKRDATLENLLSAVATSESLKLTHGIVEAIIEKSEQIEQRVGVLADKSDIETLQTSAGIMVNMLDNTATKELFTQISEQTNSIINQTDEVRKILAEITRNIDNLADTKMLDSALTKLFSNIEILQNEVSNSNIKENIHDLENKITNIVSELITIKNIVADINKSSIAKVLKAIDDIDFENESYEIKNHVSKMLSVLPQKEDIINILVSAEQNKSAIEDLARKADIIADKLDNLPTHSDMAVLNDNQLSLVENLQEVANKDDIEALSKKSDEISDMIDQLNFDDEFANIYNKTASLEEWLEKSNVKDASEKVLSEMQLKADKKDILQLLMTTEKIVSELEELSTNVDAKKVNRTVAEVYSMIEDLKNDFMNTTEMHHDSAIVQLSELQKSITKIATLEDINNFIDDLKVFVNNTVENNADIISNLAEIKSYQESILNKLDNLNLSSIEELITKQNETSVNKLTSLSEYITNLANTSKNEIKSIFSEITEIIQNKRSCFEDFEKRYSETIASIENYVKEIKNILDTSDKGIGKEVLQRINALEDIIIDYRSTHKDMLSEVLSKISNYKLLSESEDNYSKRDFESTLSELTDIKEQLTNLGKTFNSLGYEKNSEQKEVSEFVSEKLQEISSDIEQLTTTVENQLEQGFAYSAELVEEKASALLELVKTLRHNNSENIDLYERLTVTDNKLLDVKQELELINTDIISNLNSKTEELIAQIAPIKEMIMNLSLGLEDKSKEEIQEHLSVIHDTVQDDLVECTKYSQSTYDRIEGLYDRIVCSLSDTENNLRDFILGDVDSLIIKIDNLRSALDEKLDRISPPDAECMGEFREFVSQINEFKKEQKSLIEDAAEDIKSSLEDKMTAHHEELKSILAVSINNEEIITAIENLQRCFKSKIKDLKQAQALSGTTIQNQDEFDNNQYEQVFEEANKNAEIISEIKEDFNKFTKIISELSDENPEISEVLDVIREKLESVSVIKSPDIMPEIVEDDSADDVSDDDIELVTEEISDTDFEEEVDIDDDSDEDEDDDSDDIIVGANNFDIVKALDILKQDIQNLHKDVEKIIPTEEQKKASDTLKAIPTINNELLLVKLNTKIEQLSKINRDWLEEIKNYIAGSEIQALLEEISGKIDILTLSDNSEWVGEIKQSIEQLNTGEIATVTDSNKQIQATLNLINEKIDILASSEDYDVMEDVKEALERIEFTQGSDNDFSKLLNLINEKVDIIAASDNLDSIEDIKESLDEIEARLEELQSFSSGNTNTADNKNFDTIKRILYSIEDKVSTPETSDNTDFEELKASISSIERKIIDLLNDESKTIEPNNELEEIKETLSVIEAKIDDSSALQSNSLELDDIKYTLLNVDEKIDGVKKLSESDAKITAILETINHKIDILSDEETLSSKQDVEDIKHLILAQMDYIEKLEKNNKTDAVKKCLKELTVEVNNLNSLDNTKKIQKTLKEMKESIMAAVISVFEQVSFIEESEDIKDFVEYKTDEINQNLTTVTKQLKQITTSDDGPDYTYSMQDIESDLAKLRLALNNAQASEQEVQAKRLSFILDNINQIGTAVEELQDSINNEEALGLKVKFDKINTDINSLNLITSELLKKSGDSYNALNSGLEDFSKILTEQLGAKVDTVTNMLEKSNASDKVMRQALIYMGEWIDAASESMNKISTNSEEIIDVKSALEGLKSSIPEQTDILNSIEEKFDEQQERLMFFEKQISKLGNLEERFEEQQERIDRLEISLEKILSAVEDIDDSKVTRKIDKIDKQIAKLSINIEKLASYVD